MLTGKIHDLSHFGLGHFERKDPAFTDAVVDDVSDWVAAERDRDPNVLGPCLAMLDLLESGSLRRELVPEAWGVLRSVVEGVPVARAMIRS